MGKAENAVTRVILAYLRMHGALLVRVQSGTIRSGQYFIHGAEPGTADLIGVYRGRAIAIEVKTKTGRMQKSQVEWSERWKAAGGIYLVARDIHDVQGLHELRE